MAVIISAYAVVGRSYTLDCVSVSFWGWFKPHLDDVWVCWPYVSALWNETIVSVFLCTSGTDELKLVLGLRWRPAVSVVNEW